jgi:hypothetical protein
MQEGAQPRQPSGLHQTTWNLDKKILSISILLDVVDLNPTHSSSKMMLLLGIALGTSRAAALSTPEEWSDFADNFATDLAPLITLFGEQVTKQFLSESISTIDSIIFAMAPIGIITAVVSVIRLYGRPCFKALVGRAQEAHEVAEAELCSSTSHKVCELWSNGSICRVFGRP